MLYHKDKALIFEVCIIKKHYQNELKDTPEGWKKYAERVNPFLHNFSLCDIHTLKMWTLISLSPNHGTSP